VPDQISILLWLAVLFSVQVNVGGLMLLTSHVRTRQARQAALDAPVVVENLQDLLNAESDSRVVEHGLGRHESWDTDNVEALSDLFRERRENHG